VKGEWKLLLSSSAVAEVLKLMFPSLPLEELQTVKVVQELPYRDVSAAAASYTPASGCVPASLRLNLRSSQSVSRFQIPAFTFYWGSTGRHLVQVAEQCFAPFSCLHSGLLSDLYPGFTHGWSVYATQLAGELGLYASALEQVGALLVRFTAALKCVVDVSLHLPGAEVQWSRERAARYISVNTGIKEEVAMEEVERCLVAPGAACAGFVGLKQLLSLRALCRANLGAHFSTSSFHAAVLEHGPMPLHALNKHIRRWLDSQLPSLHHTSHAQSSSSSSSNGKPSAKVV